MPDIVRFRVYVDVCRIRLCTHVAYEKYLCEALPRYLPLNPNHMQSWLLRGKRPSLPGKRLVADNAQHQGLGKLRLEFLLSQSLGAVGYVDNHKR